MFPFQISSVWVFFLHPFPLSGLLLFCSFLPTVCVVIDFFKGFIHFLFKSLYHIPKSRLKWFFSPLCFSSVGLAQLFVVLLGSRGDIIVLVAIYFVFMLASGLGKIVILDADGPVLSPWAGFVPWCLSPL